MKGKDGFALVMVIILIAFLAIVSIGLVALWQGAVNQLVQQEESMQAYYLARSGAAALASWIISHPSTATSIANIKSTQIHLKSGSVGTVQVMATTTSNNGNITVISTGMVNNARETLRVSLINGFNFNKAIITKNFKNDEITGSVSIHGGIEYQSTSTLKISGSASVVGEVVSEATVIGIKSIRISPSLATSTPPPNLSNLTIDSTLIINGFTATIATVTNNTANIANTLGLKDKDVNGSWTLVTCSTESGTQYLLLSATDTSITISGTFLEPLTIYAPYASVTFNGKVGINGSIVASSITINGGGNRKNVNLPIISTISSNIFKSYIIKPGSWSY